MNNYELLIRTELLPNGALPVGKPFTIEYELIGLDPEEPWEESLRGVLDGPMKKLKADYAVLGISDIVFESKKFGVELWRRAVQAYKLPINK